MKKTAAIYDRWLSTLGGGEQVVFAYAQTLQELGYSVELLTHKRLDVQAAERKMGVSLENIEIRYLPEATSQLLSGISEKYDVFINSSHLDYFPNRSKMGILSVFFPGLLRLNPYEYIKRAFFIPSFRKLFIYPSRYEGFTHDQFINGKIYKWLSTHAGIAFKDSISKLQITLFFKSLTFSVIDSIQFSLGNEPISYSARYTNHAENTIVYSFDLKNSKDKVLTITLPDHPYAKEIALINLTIPSFRYTLYNIFKKMFPIYEMRLHGGPGVTQLSDLTSYDKIVTISAFCQKWIHNYWTLPSTILYPPVNTTMFKAAGVKKNIILHVGRFFVSGHNKKQLALAKLFKHMVNKHGITDWELHFVGSIADGENHHNYFQRVQAEAKEVPIFFHTNMPFSSLQTLFSEAKIYWHATGLDEDEQKNPVAFEHFGITTVEAMASGCVPVVIAGGGQTEIVVQETGFVCESRKDFESHTLELMRNETILQEMSIKATERSDYFSRDRFKSRFKKLLSES
ncbi:MAG: glycosyltransferase [Microgenomates group bacterium]